MTSLIQYGEDSFRIWGTAAGYGELCVWFKPIRNGKIIRNVFVSAKELKKRGFLRFLNILLMLTLLLTDLPLYVFRRQRELDRLNLKQFVEERQRVCQAS